MATKDKLVEKKLSIKDKISAKTSEKPSNWPQEAEERSAKRGALQHARRVSLLVLRELDKQNLSQVALADKMGVSRQQVTKIVKGQENFTFETIAKLEEALGISIITIDLQEMPAHLRVPVSAAAAPSHKVGDESELNLAGIKKRLEELRQLEEKLGFGPPDAAKSVSHHKAHARAVPSRLPALSELELVTLQHLQSAQEFSAFEGPSRVFRMNDLKRSDWQSKLMEVFNKLQQEPLEDFVIIGTADPSAPMPSGPGASHEARQKAR